VSLENLLHDEVIDCRVSLLCSRSDSDLVSFEWTSISVSFGWLVHYFDVAPYKPVSQLVIYSLILTIVCLSRSATHSLRHLLPRYNHISTLHDRGHCLIVMLYYLKIFHWSLLRRYVLLLHCTHITGLGLFHCIVSFKHSVHLSMMCICCVLLIIACSCMRPTVFTMQVIQMIRDDILPNSSKLPRDFIAKLMHILNRGSIHSVTSSSFIGNVKYIYHCRYFLIFFVYNLCFFICIISLISTVSVVLLLFICVWLNATAKFYQIRIILSSSSFSTFCVCVLCLRSFIVLIIAN